MLLLLFCGFSGLLLMQLPMPPGFSTEKLSLSLTHSPLSAAPVSSSIVACVCFPQCYVPSSLLLGLTQKLWELFGIHDTYTSSSLEAIINICVIPNILNSSL